MKKCVFKQVYCGDRRKFCLGGAQELFLDMGIQNAPLMPWRMLSLEVPNYLQQHDLVHALMLQQNTWQQVMYKVRLVQFTDSGAWKSDWETLLIWSLVKSNCGQYDRKNLLFKKKMTVSFEH